MLAQNIRSVAIVLAVVGLSAAFYNAFDIRYPNHFVGDMYGMEIMWRGSVLILICLPLCIGFLMTAGQTHLKGHKYSKTGFL